MSLYNYFLTNPFGPGTRTIEWIYLHRTGGTSVDLDSEPTFSADTGGTNCRIVAIDNNTAEVWQLIASDHANDPVNGWVRPLDYGTGLNEKVWKRLLCFSTGGGGGGGDKNYLHVQNLAADTWVIYHNLAKYPAIDVIDSSGNVVIGTISHIDINTAMVQFSAPFGGTATCN